MAKNELAEEFKDVTETFDDSGEWVNPEEGLVVTGKLTKAFTFASNFGTQPAYAITTKSGDVKLLSERYFLKALRKLNIGDAVQIIFTGKEKIGANTGWVGKVGVKPADKPGQSVMEALTAASAAAKSDLPF